jgi:hypothetical protein
VQLSGVPVSQFFQPVFLGKVGKTAMTAKTLATEVRASLVVTDSFIIDNSNNFSSRLCGEMSPTRG